MSADARFPDVADDWVQKSIEDLPECRDSWNMLYAMGYRLCAASLKAAPFTGSMSVCEACGYHNGPGHSKLCDFYNTSGFRAHFPTPSAELLCYGAAAAIHMRGWCTTNWMDDRGRVDLLGALCVAAGASPDYPVPRHTPLALKGPPSLLDVFDRLAWTDSENRTAAEAVTLLETTALTFRS